MRSRKVGFVALGGEGLALLVSGEIAARSGTSPRAAAAEGEQSKIKVLLKERHAAFETIAGGISEGFRKGSASRNQVVEATRATRNAELDLCDTDNDRAAVLEKMLAEAKDYEQSVEVGFQS
jgi:hypothetical protein